VYPAGPEPKISTLACLEVLDMVAGCFALKRDKALNPNGAIEVSYNRLL